MNTYLKQFLQRGLTFGGFGPIIGGIIYLSLSLSSPDFTLTGVQIFTMIISLYSLAFVQAGVSVFNQIEHWPVAKSLFCHLSCTYLAYAFCYLVNSWIPFDIGFIAVFTICFILLYFVIWLTVFFTVRSISKKLNEKLK